MPHHKRRRAKNRRAGCLMCKPWKLNGFGKMRPDAERYSDYRRRRGAELDVAAELAELLCNDREMARIPGPEEFARVQEAGDSLVEEVLWPCCVCVPVRHLARHRRFTGCGSLPIHRHEEVLTFVR